MKTIFVSCQSIDSPDPQAFIDRLEEKGFSTNHSPRNPRDGDDSRWPDWYRNGLREAMEESRSFVIIVDRGWDSSTWMGIEAEEALGRARASDGEYVIAYWNPNDIEVKAKGMLGYLKDRLPNEVGDAVEALARRLREKS